MEGERQSGKNNHGKKRTDVSRPARTHNDANNGLENFNYNLAADGAINSDDNASLGLLDSVDQASMPKQTRDIRDSSNGSDVPLDSKGITVGGDGDNKAESDSGNECRRKENSFNNAAADDQGRVVVAGNGTRRTSPASESQKLPDLATPDRSANVYGSESYNGSLGSLNACESPSVSKCKQVPAQINKRSSNTQHIPTSPEHSHSFPVPDTRPQNLHLPDIAENPESHSKLPSQGHSDYPEDGKSNLIPWKNGEATPTNLRESIASTPAGSLARIKGISRLGSSKSFERYLSAHLARDLQSLFTAPVMRKLNFVDESDNFEKLADFLVLPQGSSCHVVCDKMFQDWKLEPPKLIISVSGWSSHMPLIPPRQLLRLKQGLRRIVQSTNTWILSTGITHGVDNLVAEVLQDAQFLEWIGQDEPQLHLIGMVNWNYIRHGDEIQFWTSTPKSSDDVFCYNVNSGLDEFATLNKLFSHFIFFDSHSPTKDAELRSNLECFLSTKKEPITEEVRGNLGEIPASSTTIPTVLLVMGGELPVFEQVAKSLVNHIAVVVCEGVGGASEIIAKSLRLVRKSRKPLTPNQESNIQNLIRALAKKTNVELDEENQTELQFIKIILEYSRYVIIYRVDRPNNQIDECILKALIRSVSDIGYDALQLAMNLHQCDDVVQNIVEAESDINERKNMDEICFRALIEGQLPFLKLFLEVGFEMKRYLTPQRLSLLYQDTIESTTPLVKLLTKTVGPKQFYALKDVYFMVYYFTLGYPIFSLVDLPESDQKGFEDPFRELCFWSLFSLKPELTNYFWSKAKNPLIIALMACKLWQEIYDCLTIGEMELKEEIEPLMDEYRDLALKCLEEYQETNPDLNSFVLTYRNPMFGCIDLIDVAGFTDNKDFIATSDAQICIEHKWKSGMRCSFKGILFSLIFPFSIPQIYSEGLVTDFDEDSNNNGLTLEEEILLLEEQNQKTHAMIKRSQQLEAESLGLNGITRDATNYLKKTNQKIQMPPEDNIMLIPTVSGLGTDETGGNSHKKGVADLVNDTEVNIAQLDDNTGVSLLQTTFSQFYTAPVTKFILHILMYFIFLVIYTYFYCYENSPGLMNKWKITIFIYMVSYVIEIIWHFCQGDISFKVKLVIWCSSEWNLLDVTYLSFGILGFFLSISDGWFMIIARALYGITSILMWIRLLRFYLASEKLGSMWIMIRRMLWETLIFMTHMGIMIIASGISLYCINYKDLSEYERMDLTGMDRDQIAFINKCIEKKETYESYNRGEWLFLRPFFMFNGELFLDPLKCGNNGSIAWIMAALFLLLGNALMLNLLVAIYAAIFNDVQANSEREWKMEMYWLLKDFEEKTILPPPLSLIETAIQIVRILYNRSKKSNGFTVTESATAKPEIDDQIVPAKTITRLQIFETYCVGKALRKMAAKKTSYDSVVDMIHDTEAQLGKVQDCKVMVNNVRRMIQTQKLRRRARRRQALQTQN